MLLGGMSYQLDPDMKQAPTRGRPGDRCEHIAKGLLDCLHVGRGQKVRHVCVRKVSVDIELDNDCRCD
jgi:zinc metalloprotease ZmpB